MYLVFVLVQFVFAAVSAQVVFQDCDIGQVVVNFGENECKIGVCKKDRATSVQVILARGSRGSAFSLSEVNIEGCDMSQPCYVTLGEDVKVNLKFKGNFVARNLDQNVVININQMNLPTPVIPGSCQINDCPVQTGTMTSFNSIMSVPQRMAVNQRGHLRWRIVNESGRLVLCYSVLVQTQTTVQKLLRQYLGIIPVSKDLNFDKSDLIPGTASS